MVFWGFLWFFLFFWKRDTRDCMKIDVVYLKKRMVLLLSAFNGEFSNVLLMFIPGKHTTAC